MRIIRFMLLLLLLSLLAGCQKYWASPPAGQEGPTAEARPALPPTITPFPPGYPWPPTEVVSTRWSLPTPTVGPTPIVLGAEWAPEAERETYVSTTVVVAPVGDGPGEVGYETHGEELPTIAEQFTIDIHGNIYILDLVNRRIAQFDPGGHFVQNIPYPSRPEVWYPELIAVGPKGQVCLYDGGVNPDEAAVKCYNSEGQLIRAYSVPSWLLNKRVYAMHVDEQGTLWVEGEGYLPQSPVLETTDWPYPYVVVPLGNMLEEFEEEQQKTMAIPGHLSSSGKTLIFQALTAAGPAFLYNPYGQRIYEVMPSWGINIDSLGNLYCFQYQDGKDRYTVVKYNPRGRRITSFNLPSHIIKYRVESDGTIYSFTMDWQTHSAYYIVRWQIEK
ncbi:MAG: hypothetical protein QXU79_02990 [Candidatus Micrarchaeaceae archaeon]